MPFLTEYDSIPANDVKSRVGLVFKWLRTDWRALFDELRAQRPVFQNPAFVMVTRHTDVIDVISQHELYSVRGYASKMDPSVGPFMLARDATELNWHEKSVMRSVLRWEDLPRVRALAGAAARDSIDAASDVVDLVPSVGRLTPLRVVQTYFGFRGPDDVTMLRWSKATQTDMFRNPFNDPAAHQANLKAGAEMRDYLRGAIEAAKSPSGDDVFARLLRTMQTADAPLDKERVVSNVAGLLVGAIETTSQAVVQATEQILLRPEVRAQAEAAAKAQDIPAFDAIVWEALRFNPITGLVIRYCERDAILAPGQPYQLAVPKGTIVAACIASAMFDEAMVDDPRAFRPGRADALQFHLGFGHHECLGRHVGLQIVPEAVRQVLLTPGLKALDGAQGKIDFAGGVFPEHYWVAKSIPARKGDEQTPGAASPSEAAGAPRCRRDASRDGLRNKLEFWVLTAAPPLWRAIGRSPLAGPVNRLLINNAVNKSKPRPGPFSTRAAYTSWDSLNDRTWSARHLPPRADSSLPTIDDTARLFQRPHGAQVLSAKSTYLFPVFAQWFTDGFLRTDDKDRRRNTSNHEIDLCPLYGLNRAQTHALRLLSEMRGERGRLRTEVSADAEWAPRLYEDDGVTARPEFAVLAPPLRLEPGWPVEKRRSLFAFGGDRANASAHTAMMNTLFLREHNRIAAQLETENSTWDDERVFQTARNIVIAMLIKIVVEEYINHISPYPFQFRADPRAAYRARWNRPNWIAAEFNLLYRWHSLVPNDLAWHGRQVPVPAFSLDNRALIEAGLAAAFKMTSANPAGQLGLLNTADYLLEVEKRGIEQARFCQLASYNDYREAFGYPRVTAFDQISSDDRVIQGLERLYGQPDNIEYFVGLFAEDVRVNAAVPALIGRMVAADAFSHALTNPLLAERVFNADTLTKSGLGLIQDTTRLADVIERVTKTPASEVRMTRPDWHPI